MVSVADCSAEPILDQAKGILMDFLHCDADEAFALLQAQSLAADTEIGVVATALVGASLA